MSSAFTPSDSASSSEVGSRPVAADISPRLRSIFAIRPIWWHGTRTVRAWSAAPA